MKTARIILLALAGAWCCAAQVNAHYGGWCENGGVTVTINSGLSSSPNKFQQSYPQCTIDVYAPGTTNHATLYSTDTGTSLGNPFTANKNGTYSFFSTAPVVDIRFSGAGIPSPFTISSVGGSVTQIGEISDVTFYLAGSTFAQMCARVVALNRTVVLSEAWLSVPTQSCAMNIRAVKGGSIQPGSGQTVSLTGSFAGDMTQHFDLSAGGSVSLAGPTGNFLPEWWGAKNDWNGTTGTDNCTPYTELIASLPSTGATVSFSKGKYRSSCAFSFNLPSVAVVGQGRGDISGATAATSIVFDAGVSGIVIGLNGVGSSVRHLALFSRSTGAGADHGIRVRATMTDVDDVVMAGFGGDGWHADTDNVDTSKVTHSFFYGNFGNGWYCNSGDCNVLTIEGNRSYANGGIGFYQANGATNKFDSNDATGNTGGDYYIAGLSNFIVNNYCESGATGTMILAGNENTVESPLFGGCVITRTATGQIYIGQGAIGIDEGVLIGGAGGADSINLNPAAAGTEIKINNNGKANATMRFYRGAGGSPQITLDPNGFSIFTNGLQTPKAAIADSSTIGVITQQKCPNAVVANAMTSANNALVGTLNDALTGSPVTPVEGMELCVKLNGFTLQAGANTLTLNGVSYNIGSLYQNRSIANAYVNTGSWARFIFINGYLADESGN